MGLLDQLKGQWQQGAPYRDAAVGLLSGDSQPIRGLLGKKEYVEPMTPETAMNLALDWGPMGMIGHTVFHGSPHRFNKFDMSKIGTGEGAQAYGHGLYFAESPEVAKSYLVNAKSQKSPEFMARSYMQDYPSPQEAIIGAKERLNRLLKNGDTQEAAFQAKVVKSIETGNLGGNVYKADIPDEVMPKMLDWDKPFSSQSKEVQKAWQATKNSLPPNALDDLGGDLSMLYGKDVTPADFLGTLQSLGGKSDFGETLLKQQGIPGIRYLDGGSRSAGKGSYNYVVFDDTLPKILEINGKKVAE